MYLFTHSFWGSIYSFSFYFYFTIRDYKSGNFESYFLSLYIYSRCYCEDRRSEYFLLLFLVILKVLEHPKWEIFTEIHFYDQKILRLTFNNFFVEISFFVLFIMLPVCGHLLIAFCCSNWWRIRFRCMLNQHRKILDTGCGIKLSPMANSPEEPETNEKCSDFTAPTVNILRRSSTVLVFFNCLSIFFSVFPSFLLFDL